MLLSLVNFNFRAGLSEYWLTRVVLQAGTENFLATNTTCSSYRGSKEVRVHS